MNSFKTINVHYLRPDRTIETTLVCNGLLEKALWIYNDQGLFYRVFESISAMLNFFNSGPEAKTYFETELELDAYLEHLSL